MQLIIELLALCAIGISGIYAFMKSTAKRVKTRMDEIQAERQPINNTHQHVRPVVNAEKFEGSLYQLIGRISATLVAEVEPTINTAATLEARMMLISACQLLVHEECWGTVIQPLLKQLLRDIGNEGYNLTLEDIADRMGLYKQELNATFQEETYYGGIITFLLLEQPLSDTIERSSDLGSTIELITGIKYAIKQIGAYMRNHYYSGCLNFIR